MNTPQIFNFEQNEVRTVLVNNEPYFVGKDVASVLGYSNTKYSNEHLRLAKKLQSNLTEDFPKEMNKVDIEKWADTIRLIEERDKASIEAIEYVINWLPTNEFWFGNIRSAKKLREKFEKLKFEIKADKKNHKKQSQKLQYSNPSEYDDLPI